MTSPLLLQVLPDCGLDRWGRIGAGALARLAEGEARATLVIARLGPGILLGRHQRARSAVHVEVAGERGLPIARRLGGGRALGVTDGTLGMLLAVGPEGLSEHVAPDKVLNRYVRGLRRGLERAGVKGGVFYFGRDFIASAGRQVGVVSQDGLGTGAAVFEAILATAAPLALPEGLGAYPEHGDPRASGPPHGALGPLDPAAAARAIGAGYAEVNACDVVAADAPLAEADALLPPALEEEAGWERSGVADVPIGFAEALVRHDGTLALEVRLRGDFIAPAFVIAQLESALAGCPLTFEELGRRVDAAFRQPGAALHGVVKLRVFADAVLAAAGKL